MSRTRLGLNLLAVLLIAGCGNSPPGLRVIAGGHPVQVQRFSYCWSQFGRGECADPPPLTDVLKRADLKAAVVTPGASVRLAFDRAPSELAVNLVDVVTGRVTPVAVRTDLRFTAPQQTDAYAYLVSARWREGHVDYLFKLRVKP